MSVLEFVSSLKWPIVVLVALGVVSRGFKNPENGRWFRDFLGRRDINVKVGPAEAAATLSAAAADAVQAATSTDEELAASSEDAASSGMDQSAQGDQPVARINESVVGLRREAVEAVMRTSAQWGWQMSQLGFRSAPDPVIEWDAEGSPRILFGSGGDLAPGYEQHLLNAAEFDRRAYLRYLESSDRSGRRYVDADGLKDAVRRRMEAMERERRKGRD